MNSDAVDGLRLAVLAIEAPQPPSVPAGDEVGAKKLLTILAGHDADLTADRDGLRVQWSNRWRPMEYFPSLSAHLVSILRMGAPDLRLDRPFTLQPMMLRQFTFKRVVLERWIWVAWSSESIQIQCRVPTAAMSQPSTPGALAPWASPPLRFARFAPWRKCGTCGVESESFRYLGDILVCLRCGCSEPIRNGAPPEAVVEAAG